MEHLNQAPYGTWISPLNPNSLTSRRVRVSGLRIDGLDTYWIEHRLNEDGRHVLLRRKSNGLIGEVLPMASDYRLMDVQIEINGHNGRAYAVKNGIIVANQYSDNRVYLYDSHRKTMSRMFPLTPGTDSHYGDFEIDLARGVVYAVEESTQHHASNRLVAIPLNGSAARDYDNIMVLTEESDFSANPTLSPDGQALAWISWEHPHMPWTQSALHVGRLKETGQIKDSITLVDAEDVCVYEPRWTMTGDLMHVDDSTDWANFYRTEGFNFEAEADWAKHLKTRIVHPAPQAFSSPQWELGMHSYDNFSLDEIICSWSKNSFKHIGVLNVRNGQLEESELSWRPYGNVVCENGRLVFLGATENEPPSIVEVHNGQATVLRSSADLELEPENISLGKAIAWQSLDDFLVHGIYYPPKNASYRGTEDEKPPLIVNVHAGPTSAAKPCLYWEVQFWTTRGYAYLDVDYRGSTGYGKHYREALNGHWGIMDSQDVISGAQYVIDQGWVDPKRVVVRGFSAGALTAMNCMWQSNLFKAVSAVSGYWDLTSIESRTSKFESFLAKRLLGDNKNAYADASPINFVDKINGEVLIFQAETDGLSTVSETTTFVEKLKSAQVPVELELIPGEDHSMQKRSSINDIFAKELEFFTKVLNLESNK